MNGVSREVESAREPLAALLDETSLSWSAAGAGWAAETGTVTVRAEANGEEAAFSIELIEFENLAAPAQRALAVFVDALNRRWHPARGLLSGDKVVVQVALPAASCGPDDVERAVETLLFAHRMAKKECAALVHAQVAQLYLQFHEGENNTNGNHDD